MWGFLHDLPYLVKIQSYFLCIRNIMIDNDQIVSRLIFV